MTDVPPPLALLAELTYRCPLQCPYCSNPLELERAKRELDTETWLRVLGEAADLGVLQVHFSGGEPTARTDLEQLVAGAAMLGLYGNLITSGVLLNEAKIAALAEAGLEHVQLSFQDAEATGGDRIGGYKGGHEKKIQVAKLVRKAGLPLTLNMVVHRQNLDRLEDMIQLAVDLDARRVEIAHVQYYGWGLKNRAALMPTREQLETATATVDKARERLKGVLAFDYVVPDYYARRPKACMGGWGRRFLNVNPAGLVMPCHAAETIPGLRFDSVRNNNLAEIWANSEAFTRFRGTAWMPEPCRSCDRREIDWGGCRCQALAVTGDVTATDPACELSPNHNKMLEIADVESDSPPSAFVYRRMGGASALKKPEPV
ncbi:MAG TPA: pyrroloquinoline quinone biosynthesis protein PqqE, partial [Rhodospirillales bacterium]